MESFGQVSEATLKQVGSSAELTSFREESDEITFQQAFGTLANAKMRSIRLQVSPLEPTHNSPSDHGAYQKQELLGSHENKQQLRLPSPQCEPEGSLQPLGQAHNKINHLGIPPMGTLKETCEVRCPLIWVSGLKEISCWSY